MISILLLVLVVEGEPVGQELRQVEVPIRRQLAELRDVASSHIGGGSSLLNSGRIRRDGETLHCFGNGREEGLDSPAGKSSEGAKWRA